MIAESQFSMQADDRLRCLARKMLRQFPLLRRWEETDDVLQEASLRLSRALMAVSPESELHLHRLAALQLRRVLLNLAAQYSSPFHFAANYDTGFEDTHRQHVGDRDVARKSEPAHMDAWIEFHRIAGTLPSPQQDAFDLLWYGGMSQDDAARILGLTKRTLQRRWREARLELIRQLDGDFPA